MAFDKDQSVDTDFGRPQPAVEMRPEIDSEPAFGPALSAPAIERGMLPPPDGIPQAARAAEMLSAATATPDVAARARMSIALQMSVGNARMASMLQTVPEPKAPPPAPPRIEAAPPQPAAAPPQPAVTSPTPAAKPQEPPRPVTPPAPAPAQKDAARGDEEKPDAAAGGESAAPAQAAPPQTAAPAAKGEAAALGSAGKPAAGKAAAEVGGAGGGVEGGEAAAAAAGRSDVKLRMPEPPADIPPKTRQRIGRVKAAAGKAEVTQTDLPPAGDLTQEARGAVTQPKEEADALAQEARVKELVARTPPSAKIEKLCQDIYRVIRSKRPPDEDSLTEAKPQEMAQAAGDLMKGNVEGDVQSVDQSYDPLDKMPAGQKGPEKDPPKAPPESVPVPPVNARQATPDAVPAQNVSLDADVEDNKRRMAEAGMETEPAKLGQTGPHAEAREELSGLEESAKTDPAKVLAEQQAALAKADGDLLALQQQALGAMTGSRRRTVSGAADQQKTMVKSEAATRASVSRDAQLIVKGAQDEVNKLLLGLPQKTMAVWNARVNKASREFDDQLAHVAKKIKSRHSGWFGWARRGVDYVSGLPAWVTKLYNKAEKKFGDDICALARELSSGVNLIIAECERIIGAAEVEVAALFQRNRKQLGDWADTEQAKFGAQLNTLRKRAHDTRDNFERDLVERASQAVQDVRVQIHELREKAKGLIGRIADAIGRFLDDPVKFIIESLLDLLSIPRAAFWAVVAKIKKVIGQIADDPEKFANNLMDAVGKGFSQFFERIDTHLINGFVDWLTGGLAGAGVELPRDLTLKSLITFFLQLMGIGWPLVRKLIAKRVGPENVALIEKAYSVVANLIALGPEGIFELIKERLNPQSILDQIIEAAVDYMTKSVIAGVAKRVLLLFNPVGAILAAIEAIYRVLKWIFTNAARIFKLIETIVDGIADIIAGNIGGMANAIEKALAGLIPPVIDFLADYLGFGDLPDKVRDTILGFQDWVAGILDSVIGWLIEKGKALLALVGVGGEKEGEKKGEEKKGGEQPAESQVGKTVMWSAGAEEHQLWIEIHNADALVMMSSAKKNTLAAHLDDYEKEANALTAAGDAERKKTALDNIEAARTLLTAIDAKADGAARLATEPAANPAQLQAGDKDVERAEDMLWPKLKAIQIALGKTLIPPTIVSSSGGATEKSVLAEPLSKLPGNTVGSPPQEDPLGWKHVEGIDFSKLDVSESGRERWGVRFWRRTHLLNDNLHGPGRKWNLVPALEFYNSAMKNGPEKDAKERVLEKGEVLYYHTKVEFHPDPIPEGFPSAISVEYGSMRLTGDGKWERAGAIKTYPWSPEAPPLSTRDPVSINAFGRDALIDKGFPAQLARNMSDELKAGPFKGEEDFKARMRAYYPTDAAGVNKFDKQYWPVVVDRLKSENLKI